MKYQELFCEENEAVMERYQLTMERIASIGTEKTAVQNLIGHIFAVRQNLF